LIYDHFFVRLAYLARRLTNISHDEPGGNLLFTNYTLDANGNRTAMASNAGTESYTLDALNRLTTSPNRQFSYL
jgi:hypothetical protein